MKAVLIATKLYLQELTDFYLCDIPERIIKHEREGEYSYLRVEYKNFDFEQLTQFFEDLILDKNSAVNSSLRLHNMVKQLAFCPAIHEKIKGGLIRHIRAERRLDIDGYMNFRLREYNYLINEILYKAVKKSLCFECQY